jgi:hypothetical protein
MFVNKRQRFQQPKRDNLNAIFSTTISDKEKKEVDTRSQCNKTLIYRHSTVTPSLCGIKQYYDHYYRGMEVSNTSELYCDISTLEITGIFITQAVNYHGI